jgi:hypothetical protein
MEIVFGVVLRPMAAILGLQQRLLSKFRITTNGGQCILWKLLHCEMGIDVRSYAEKEKTLFVPV